MADTSLIFNIFARNKTQKAFREISTGAKIAFAAVGVAAVKFGADSVKAYAESEQQQAKLEDAYKRFPSLASGNIAALQKLATERAKVTRFDDDATAAAAANLAQFGLNQTQLEQMIPLVQDYAAKTGKDLPGASKAVGKALMGNARALKELGVNYKPTGDKAKDLAAIQEILTKQVGGFAEKEGKTAAGQAAILSNQFGEVQETVGKALMPALMGLAGFATSTLIPAVQGMATWIGENSDVIFPLVGIIGTLVAGIKVWTIAQAALNVVMALNPIGLVVIAIAALVAGIVIAYQRSETFRKIVAAAWEGIQKAASAVVEWFKTTAWPVIKWVIDAVVGYYKFLWTTFSNVVKWILDKGAKLSSWFRELPGKIGGFFSTIADTIKSPFRAAFEGIRSLWNSTIGGKGFTVPDWVKYVPGGSAFAGKSITIPMLAQGGTAVSAGMALVGENGPELLRMPRGASVIPLDRKSQGGGLVIQHLEVRAAPGERAEESLPRAMRRTVFELGLGGV